MQRILGLDGIRAMAALMVVVTHLHIFIAWDESESPFYGLVWGVNGVKIFFILSGFLITHLLLVENEKYGKIKLKLFLIRRSLRIFPLFYLFIFAVIVIGIFFETKTSWFQIFISSIYGFNFMPRSGNNDTLGHTWSLAVEEHFYLIWPTLLILIIKKRKSFNRLLLVTGVIYLVLEFFNYYLHNYTSLNDDYNIAGWTTGSARFLLAGCFGGILIHTRKWKEVCGTRNLNIALFTIFILGYFVDFWFHNDSPIISRNLRTAGILSGILIIVNNQDWMIVKILEMAPIRYLGQVSYGIYVWQGFYLGTGPGRDIGQNWPPDAYIGLILLIITVPLSYHLFEVKFLKMKERFRPNR